MVNIKEKNGAILITVNGRRGPIHRSVSVEDAEELLQDLETAVDSAKKNNSA
ncbi:hypothetical protein ACH9L7_20195 (plasmid) [Haloferax sp. S1W]|uniref:hypothetical protein n=1 Tax=Haloferax TaxID=2251 RepID=UPI00135F17DC|nr:hypothetical protein [Haloferax gibbonsii]